jgi:hypothetical protein
VPLHSICTRTLTFENIGPQVFAGGSHGTIENYVYDDVTYVYDDVTYVYDDVTMCMMMRHMCMMQVFAGGSHGTIYRKLCV